MYKTYKYRIYPNKDQQKLIDKTFAVNRFVYNIALETKITLYKDYGVSLSAFDLQKQLIEVKKDNIWIKEVDSQSLKQTILNLDKAYQNFFKGGGFPKFKSKRDKQSFQCPCNKREVDFEHNTISIPKIYKIKTCISQKFEGKIKTITISKTPTNKYFASILVEVPLNLPNKKEVSKDGSLGVDVGIKDLAILSNGVIIPNNKYLKNSIKRLKVLQRRASRKKKGSNNRKKANLKVALLHEKITNQRKDYLHKSVNKIINDNQVETIFIEDLNVRGMMKNHKLAQSLSDVSLGEFFRILKYKCEWQGINLVEIGRFDPSSKRCFECGCINNNLKLSDRVWTCENGHILDRDINAAKNIKHFGLIKSGQGLPEESVELPPLDGALKQE